MSEPKIRQWRACVRRLDVCEYVPDMTPTDRDGYVLYSDHVAAVAETQQRCREAAQILIAAIGAPGPEDVTTTARQAVERIERFRARVAELEALLRRVLPTPAACGCGVWELQHREPELDKTHHPDCLWHSVHASLPAQVPPAPTSEEVAS